MQKPDNMIDNPLPDIVARFRIRKGLFSRELVEAPLFDLNQNACVLKTDKLFEPGDPLTLDLDMAMPFENLRVSGFTGVVTERIKYCSNFFYSIDFIGNELKKKPRDSGTFRRIMEVLDRKQALLSRREPGAAVVGGLGSELA